MYGKRKLTALAAVAAFSLSLALSACGSETMTTATQPTALPTTVPTALPSMPGGTTGGEFGPACAGIPTDPANPGSLAMMAQQPVATAAAANPQLSTLVAAIQAGDLADTLNSAEAVTVFAPTNEAFAKIPKADLDKVLADKDMLKKILTYHVVSGKTAPDALAGTHKTLEGQDITVTGSGTDFKVNDTAMIVCGNIQTRNGVVYLVDSVLMPPS
ncbi:fasciclin domain-containing protein [Catellatospora citrea]|uniref:Lipoprotein n=1 Tax=Catellatospora citrea TaxID=53366 RepID=A0A8J3NY77_9ACTN|nr:fasciclin domain-containing protein [Catellatospora citrea]RKE11006.1 putative surface protein with fasciclin (FAS1) repeats [Catellatospora citrea]GIF96461.1 lipoprotein [Catellatospora citrea]